MTASPIDFHFCNDETNKYATKVLHKLLRPSKTIRVHNYMWVDLNVSSQARAFSYLIKSLFEA